MVIRVTFGAKLTFVWPHSIISITMLRQAIAGTGYTGLLGVSSHVCHWATAPYFVFTSIKS